MVAGMHAIGGDFARSNAPVFDIARAYGVTLLAIVLTGAGLVTSFTVVLASIVAGARVLYQLARHGVLPEPFRRVHPANRTPGFSIAAATLISIAAIAPLSLSGVDPRAIWDYLGSICTFGFLLAYLLIVVGTPLYLYRNHALRPANLLIAASAAVAVLVPLVSSIYPVPDYPHNLVIYIFAALLALGMGWFFLLRRRHPAIVIEIKGHLDTTYQRFALDRIANSEASL